MPRDYRSAANRYRPAPIRVIFIAESPPAYLPGSKKSYFFFEENPGSDILFATIVQAVLYIRYRKWDSPSKEQLLQAFKANCNWLMDAVEYPINKIDGIST